MKPSIMPLAAEDYSLLESLLETHIANILKRGEFTNLLRWFEIALPETTYFPELSLIYAFVLTVTGQTERAAVQLRAIEQQVETVDNTERHKHIQSGILFLKSNLLFFIGNYEEWQLFVDEIEEGMLPDTGVFYNFNYNSTEPLVKRTPIGLKGVTSRNGKNRTLSNYMKKPDPLFYKRIRFS
ncbi:hypothetical protein [Paenibacillus eucommiae]|uniref:ATP/maltotriose-dependent transcriptional regulator MalT n=1 Tax=Paenibacillus eucommiae TaxID=1355755 RepID=A0ABS4IUH3_9BACL|nr:hypothetical protein [Paenibacillus eucommiae]MBP1991224.1 ATP/maltotriose-dependent transcriptional regulator MalT [Paenibacillus eucommiae]